MAGTADHDRRAAAPADQETSVPSRPPAIRTDDRPGITSDGRYVPRTGGGPPDPRAVIDDLRRRLRAEQEKTLNSVDAVLGAQAAAAQARAETQDVYYRLHVRETELAQLKELLDGSSDRFRTGAELETGARGGSAVEADTTEREPYPMPGEALRILVGSILRAAGLR